MYSALEQRCEYFVCLVHAVQSRQRHGYARTFRDFRGAAQPDPHALLFKNTENDQKQMSFNRISMENQIIFV